MTIKIQQERGEKDVGFQDRKWIACCIASKSVKMASKFRR